MLSLIFRLSVTEVLGWFVRATPTHSITAWENPECCCYTTLQTTILHTNTFFFSFLLFNFFLIISAYCIVYMQYLMATDPNLETWKLV